MPSTGVVTDEEAAREIVSSPEVFSANLPKYDRTVQAAMPCVVPLHADPPEHTAFRRILAPLFTAAAVRAHEQRVRTIARRLVAAVREAGEADFPRQIAQPFHVAVFTDTGSFTRASAALGQFYAQTIAARRRQPGTDLLSHLLAADYQGRPMDDATMISLCGNRPRHRGCHRLARHGHACPASGFAPGVASAAATAAGPGRG